MTRRRVSEVHPRCRTYQFFGPFRCGVIVHCVGVHFFYSFTNGYIFGLFSFSAHCEWCCCEHFWAGRGHLGFQFSQVDTSLLSFGPSAGVPQTRVRGPAPLFASCLALASHSASLSSSVQWSCKKLVSAQRAVVRTQRAEGARVLSSTICGPPLPGPLCLGNAPEVTALMAYSLYTLCVQWWLHLQGSRGRTLAAWYAGQERAAWHSLPRPLLASLLPLLEESASSPSR